MIDSLLTGEDWYCWENLQRHLQESGYNKGFIEQIQLVAIASSYALNQLSQKPPLLENLQQLEAFTLDDFPNIVDNNCPVDMISVKQKLRQYRHLKLIEIIFLDVVKQIPLQPTLRHISDLADLLIQQALNACEKQLADKHGQPLDADGEAMHLNVVAMGKLGGRELNFSSDIDLICCYDSDGELSGFGHLSYQEFFSRCARELSKCLSDNTEDGFVYRVDLRLRPWGDSGPAVISHAGFEHYYQLHGREWEQYAMVKARVLTGSQSDRDYLASIIKPFVYRKYHDYRVFEGLATLKDKINRQAQTRGMQENVKLGPGGIREIEFFVQAFQILKGGRNNQLQNPQILHCLDVLENQAIIDLQTIQDLRAAYTFLRILENRIQMLEDQQTHQLPQDEQSRNRIAKAMAATDWQEVDQLQQQHRHKISKYFKELFKREDSSEKKTDLTLDHIFGEEGGLDEQIELLQSLGIEQPEAIQARLSQFFQSKAWSYMSAKAKQRFGTLLPELLRLIAESAEPDVLCERLMNLFSSIAGRSVYFELLHQNPLLLVKLTDLFSKSEWIADEVARYPILLEQLIHSGDLQTRFDRASLQKRLNLQLSNVVDDAELELDVLRLFKREQTIIIATAELAEEITTTEVSRYLCELAEVLLDAVYLLAQQTIEKKHGIAQFVLDGKTQTAEFAIIGYGKLGGNEMHYQSDLDVIFLHNSTGETQQSSGPKILDNSFYFARLAQKIISMTSVLTGSGKLYEIDSRLRPEGSSGLLVSSTKAYLKYQLEKAWTWEHQALVRARHVVGSSLLATQFSEMRQQILTLPRESEQLGRDIVEMREKMYASKQPSEGEFINLKHSRGCMIDIEFMVQYWTLLHANKVDSICSYSDNISLLNELIRLKLIASSHSQLIDIYLTYHRCLHETVLQNKPAQIESRIIEAEVSQVRQCWNECFCL